MSVIQCDKGLHFYDYEKYACCPYCLKDSAKDEQKTVAMYHSDYMQETPPEESKTVSIEAEASRQIDPINKQDYTVGWIVCIDGPGKGRDYRVFDGKNMIGRDYSMTICIQEDRQISRENHCAVVYDSKHNVFYLMPVENMVYVEDKMLEEAIELKAETEFVIGSSRFVFIPFCGGERKW